MDFRSDSLPVADRPTGYEGALRHYFSSFDTAIDVQVEATALESFAASLEPVAIGHLCGAIHCSNSPHSLHAQPVVAGPLGIDFYLIRTGQISFSDYNGTIDLSSGDMALLRSDAEFQSRSEGVEMIALGLPESALRARAADGGWKVGRRIRGESAFASCLAALLRTAVARHRDLTVTEGAILQMAILDSIAQLGGVGQESNLGFGLSAQQQEKLNHLKTLGLRSLHVPDLSPAALAQEAGVSPRTLHRLFFASGVTFRSWLRDSRLERCWQELTDPGRRRGTIAAIAFRWGFNDLRTFNRAFSARYRMTPQAARESAGQGTHSAC